VDWAGNVRAICSDGTQWKVIEESIPQSNLSPSSRPVGNESLPLGQTVKVRYSHYWPPLGGVNCSQFVGGKCISKMASGKPWADYIGEAVACPKEWTFGTLVLLDGQLWTCLDRGGSIKYVDGIPWLDFLSETGVYSYGEIVNVQVIAGS